MATWYKAYQTLSRHPKTLKLARLIKADRRYAVGLLHDLFSWGMDVAGKYGELPDLEAEDIAAALDLTGKKGTGTVQALVDCGFLDLEDGNYAIHDWYDYNGNLAERREKDRVRKSKNANGIPQEIRRNSDGTDAEFHTLDKSKSKSRVDITTPVEIHTGGAYLSTRERARARVDDDFGRCMGAIMDRLNPSPSSAMVEDVKHFLETLDADVIVWAVNTAADENKTGWSYVKAILNRCKNSNLTTMTAVREHERQRMKRKEAKQGGTDYESDAEANARWGIKYSV